MTTRSELLYQRALKRLPGGVNSPVRAMRSIGREPIFIASGAGSRIHDVDGNDYVDYVCSWGPLILGHAHPRVIEAVTRAARDGTSFGAPTAGEVELAEQIAELGPRMASFRGISHCYERPTYQDWPYSVFTMAHGRSKEECDAILDSIAADTQITDRSTLYSSTEFKKIRLEYFTSAHRDWEREHAGV